ncbi:hypothetical protein [Myxococcus vastator]|uniref:hypothetical protein n=1 Tax=Myxococcus vastator TaxID=2709664 RepID=UPI0013D73D92|nr:hypothetical protein [Myxococcus vastator]
MLVPLLITVGAWTPGIFTWGAGLIGLGTTCGIIVWLAHLARERGRAAEEVLFKSWGGSPTTVWLRHQSSKLDAVTKARYFAFFKKHIPKWRAPTEEDESKSLADADGYYASAVRWLLEYTRDRKRFRMVFDENVSYGFRRNLYGLKRWGITLAALCLVINAAFLVGSFNGFANFLPGRGLVSFGVCVTTILAWSSVVRPQWVRDAAEAYAKALLACCETVTKKE